MSAAGRGPCPGALLPLLTRATLRDHEVEQLLRGQVFDVVVDARRGRLIVRGREVELGQGALSVRMLSRLGASRGGCTQAELLAQMWPARGKYLGTPAALHFQVSALRMLLHQELPGVGLLETTPSGYRLASGLSVALLQASQHRPPRRSLSGAIRSCLSELGYVDNRNLCQRSTCSRRTAHHALRRLVDAGALELRGRGRACRYHAAGGRPVGQYGQAHRCAPISAATMEHPRKTSSSTSFDPSEARCPEDRTGLF